MMQVAANKNKGDNMKTERQPIRSSAERLAEVESNLKALTESVGGFLDALRTVLMKVADLEVTQEQALKKVSDDLKALKGTLVDSNPNLSEMIREKAIENKVNELTNALDLMKTQGHIKEGNGEITEKSFLVLQEFGPAGEIISARTQVILAGLEEEVKNSLLGKKVGETIGLGDGKATVSIQEVYEIVG